jgi:hypothetical protein
MYRDVASLAKMNLRDPREANEKVSALTLGTGAGGKHASCYKRGVSVFKSPVSKFVQQKRIQALCASVCKIQAKIGLSSLIMKVRSSYATSFTQHHSDS